MSQLKKMIKIVRAGLYNQSEKFIDQHNLSLFAQEIRDCENAMQSVKLELGQIMASGKQLKRQIKNAELNIQQTEEQVKYALEQELEDDAQQLAIGVIQSQQQMSQMQLQLSQLQNEEIILKQELTQAATHIRTFKLELSRLQSQLRINRVTQNLSQNTRPSSFVEAENTMMEIREKSQQQKERMLSMQELDQDLNPLLTIQAHKLELQAQELVQKLRKDS